jgi:hypothetical protein
MPNPDDPEHRARRRHRRHPCNRRITVSFQEKERSQAMQGLAVSVSKGGLGAVIDGYLSNDQAVSIQFREDRQFEDLKLEARVRYHHGFRHGFEFVDPSQLPPAKFQQLMSEQPPWM